jgi:hypothetical protein
MAPHMCLRPFPSKRSARRQRPLNISGRGLMWHSASRVWRRRKSGQPDFDGIDVSPATALTADANGDLAGTFTIPRAGARRWHKTVTATGQGGSTASATFVAPGVADHTTLRQVRTVTSTTIDPLAQPSCWMRIRSWAAWTCGLRARGRTACGCRSRGQLGTPRDCPGRAVVPRNHCSDRRRAHPCAFDAPVPLTGATSMRLWSFATTRIQPWP